MNVLTTVCLVFLVSVLSGQQRTTVILINGIATEVTLSSSGEILEVHKEIPGYMVEYDSQDKNLVSNSESDHIHPVSSSDTDLILEFKEGRAVMNTSIIVQLDEVASRIDKQNQLIMLSTSYNMDKVDNDKLAKNRVSAIKKYLELKGINPSKVLISIDNNYSKTNAVRLLYK